MASFQAKTRWERPRKSENKNFRSSISYSIRNRELKKYSKKIQNTKKRHNRFFSSPNWLGKVEKE